MLTNVFINALNSLVTTENLRNAAPISGSSFDNAALPRRSNDRTKHISLSTWSANGKYAQTYYKTFAFQWNNNNKFQEDTISREIMK